VKSHTFMRLAAGCGIAVSMEVNVLENKKNVPAPEMTSNGKFRCKADKNEYDTREDYEAHCMEEHPGGM
jgi:hypothetical protein